jgi:uncharacterized membrane protein YsdA (DUF1294 family)
VTYKNPRLYFSLFAALLFFGSWSALVATTTLALVVSIAISLSVTGFACMGFDKSLARSQSPRVPEIVLFMIALLGGSPGIFFGVHFFKHKTKKAYFQFVLLLIFCAQLYLTRLFEVSFIQE